MRGFDCFIGELGVMTMPLSWKLGLAAAGLVVAAFAWNGATQYLAARHADELVRDYERGAELDARLAKASAQQRSAERAAKLQRQRDDRADTYREVGEQAAQYQVELRRKQEAQQQEARRIEASYRLGPSQRCAGGIVINRSASKFTQAVGKTGKPIKCQGDTAAEPLR